MNRNQIRAKTVGAQKQFKKKLVDIDGEQIEVREPSIKSRGQIFKRAKAQSGDREKMDLAEFQVTAVIECSFVPGTNDRVFEDGDRDALLDMSAGGFVDDLFRTVTELMNVNEEELEKN